MAIDGTYKGTARAFMGQTDCELTLHAEGNKLTGRAHALGLSSDLENGTVDGDTFFFNIAGNGPLGYMVCDVKGKADGDRISGDIRAGFVHARYDLARV